MQFGKFLGSLHIGWVFSRSVYSLHIHQRIEEAKVAVHLDKFLLVSIILTSIISQEGFTIAHRNNLWRRLLYLSISLQCLQPGGKMQRIYSLIAEQAFDKQAVECLQDTLSFLVSRHILFAFTKSLQYLVANLRGWHHFSFKRFQSGFDFLIAELQFLCHNFRCRWEHSKALPSYYSTDSRKQKPSDFKRLF